MADLLLSWLWNGKQQEQKALTVNSGSKAKRE
jgi:hypothetical protein